MRKLLRQLWGVLEDPFEERTRHSREADLATVVVLFGATIFYAYLFLLLLLEVVE